MANGLPGLHRRAVRGGQLSATRRRSGRSSINDAAAAGPAHRLGLHRGADPGPDVQAVPDRRGGQRDDQPLRARSTPNPTTGQLTTVFDQNPQLPFSDLNLSPVRRPAGGARQPRDVRHVHDDVRHRAVAVARDPMRRRPRRSTSPAAPARSPRRSRAGTTNPSAGAFSPFTLTFSRSGRRPGAVEHHRDAASGPVREDRRRAAVLRTPPPTPAPAAPSSRVGTATVGSGAGSHPLFLSGPVYLTGPYNGGAYGLATVIPAIAGPYNLGHGGRAPVAADRPQRRARDGGLGSVPDDPRRRAAADQDGQPDARPAELHRQPDLVLGVDAIARDDHLGRRSGRAGVVAVPGRAAAADCRSLRRLGSSLTGKGQTTSGKHPTLTATLKAPTSGQANIQSAKVTLPLSLALDPNNTAGRVLGRGRRGAQLPGQDTIVGHGHRGVAAAAAIRSAARSTWSRAFEPTPRVSRSRRCRRC